GFVRMIETARQQFPSGQDDGPPQEDVGAELLDQPQQPRFEPDFGDRVNGAGGLAAQELEHRITSPAGTPSPALHASSDTGRRSSRCNNGSQGTPRRGIRRSPSA